MNSRALALGELLHASAESGVVNGAAGEIIDRNPTCKAVGEVLMAPTTSVGHGSVSLFARRGAGTVATRNHRREQKLCLQREYDHGTARDEARTKQTSCGPHTPSAAASGRLQPRMAGALASTDPSTRPTRPRSQCGTGIGGRAVERARPLVDRGSCGAYGGWPWRRLPSRSIRIDEKRELPVSELDREPDGAPVHHRVP